MTRLVTALWHGDDARARVVRALLSPAERMFTAIVARRNRKFDAKPAVPTALPALSVGNLTVGGTGKTPVAAWCVRELQQRGASPAIVLRGYGDDEWRVHSLLNPGVPVIVSVDRVEGIAMASAQGADCVVLDDAFQHRRADRLADLVLLSADEWNGRVRLLPAGPFREPLVALRRATVAVITVKSAGDDAIQRLTASIDRAAPAVPVAVVRLQPDSLHSASSLPAAASIEAGGVNVPGRDASSDGSRALEWLAGRRIVATSAIGDPAAFEAQLRGLGAQIIHAARFADHHAFSASDARRIAALAAGAEGVVCTLKDAVKLHSVWPREGAPLWYVSQSVVVDRGAEALDRAFARVLAARTATRLSPPAEPAQTRLHGH
jgi:tetraacyldisaccharide 4'-kinase